MKSGTEVSEELEVEVDRGTCVEEDDDFDLSLRGGAVDEVRDEVKDLLEAVREEDDRVG